MSQQQHGPRTGSSLGLTAVGLVVVVAAILGTLADRYGSFPASSLFSGVLSGRVPSGPVLSGSGPATRADGALPDGVTVFDGEYPGVANLDPDLLRALREAATDAAHEGIEFHVNSGWRSPEYQNQLLREAVSKYGSKAEAARWVATADTSPHVSGDAVDIGPSDATEWLSEHGAAYGLCRIYGNEPWHYELRPERPTAGARHCTPTPRTIRGCSLDRRPRSQSKRTEPIVAICPPTDPA